MEVSGCDIVVCVQHAQRGKYRKRLRGKTRANVGTTQHTAARASPMGTTGARLPLRKFHHAPISKWLPQGREAMHTQVSLFSDLSTPQRSPMFAASHPRGTPAKTRPEGPNLGHKFKTTNASTNATHPPEFAEIRPFWAKLTGRVTLYSSPPTFMSCETGKCNTHN
jgi:hypothetical protein